MDSLTERNEYIRLVALSFRLPEDELANFVGLLLEAVRDGQDGC